MSSKSVFDEVYSKPSNVFDEVYTPKKEEEGFLKARTRNLGVATTGLAKLHPANLASEAVKLLAQGESLSELEDLEERIPELMKKFPQAPWENFKGLDRDKFLQAIESASKTFPTVSNIAPIVEQETGLPLTPKTETDKAIDFISQIVGAKGGSIPEKVMSGLKGQATKSTLNAAGVPEPASDLLGLYNALRTKTAPVNVSKTAEKPLPGSKPSEPPPKTLVPEKFESGLSKPRAVEAEKPERALISKGRQRQVIAGLEKEAQGLIKERVSERVPISEKIKEGFDFETYHAKEFGELKAAAQKFNPAIEVDPLLDFFASTREKYRGIPSPHGDAKSILNIIKSYRRTTPSDLATLYKIRRSNGQKLNEIYDQRLMKGKRKEYVDFLNDMNRKIDESIQKTLPADSAWFKKYKQLNDEYKQYRNAEDTLKFLEPILKEKLSTSALTKIAEDPQKQKYLGFKMGKEGASEVIQISKDLKKAIESIKKMTVKEFNKFDSVWPISFIFKPAGIAVAVKKGIDYTRRGYGLYLSSPAQREVFDEALKAVASNDLAAYEKATEKLSK